MGGTIGVDSTAGVGSTFWVELAAGEALAVEPTNRDDLPVLALRAYPRERRLLYVEDTAANVLLVEEMLRRRPSIRVDLGDPRRARAGLGAREQRPTPSCSTSTCRTCRARRCSRGCRPTRPRASIPVAILTADVTARRAEPLLEAGAAAYLTKPIALRELLDVVDTLLGERLDDAAPSAARTAVDRHGRGGLHPRRSSSVWTAVICGTKRNANRVSDASTVSHERMSTARSSGLALPVRLRSTSEPSRSTSIVGGSGSNGSPSARRSR